MFPVKVETRILLNCPHCSFSSRYDTGFLEDAIHDHKEISCVACGGHFLLSVVVVDKAVQQNAHQTGGESAAKVGFLTLEEDAAIKADNTPAQPLVA